MVSGSEDGTVYLFDIESGVKVNTLQGHTCPVLGVAWNYDESVLATCDQQVGVYMRGANSKCLYFVSFII